MPPSPPRPASLADTLRALSDEELVAVFQARPDLVTPLPPDLDQVAARAATRSSVVRVLDRLDRRALTAVLALVLLTGRREPTSVADLDALMGSTGVPVRSLLLALRALVLAYGPDSDLAVPPVLAEIFGPYPAGLGPPAAVALASAGPARLALAEKLADGAVIERLLEEAGPEARQIAERMAAGPPVAELARADRELTVETARNPVEALLARGLLAAIDGRTVILPREVALQLRGGQISPPAELVPPLLEGPTRDPLLISRTAAGTTLEVVRRVEVLLDDWGFAPPAVLKAGGLGVRDLRRAAARIGSEEAEAALLLECAYAAGLVGPTEDETWLPTPAYDAWLVQDPARRWAVLAASWFGSTRVAALAGSRDERDRLRSVLSPELDRKVAPELRQLVLDTLASASPGTGLTPETVLAAVRWRRPRRTNPFVEDLVRWTLAEAALLGVTGLSSLSAHGRALAAGSDVAGALAPLLPEPVDHVLLQADLTAVAPGPLLPDLARSLAEVADAESHGGATVYRFTPESVRRALDSGRSASDLHALLAAHSTTPVPQPLTYLIDDVARRHGHLRVGTAACYLRCDDETLLSSLVADKRTAPLRLRRLAPTVVISPQPVKVVVDDLRELGYAPVPETPDGALLLSAPRSGRAPERRPRTGLSAPDPAVFVAAVRALRAGDRARSSRPAGAVIGRMPRTASTEAVEVLKAAVAGGFTVWMGYVDQHGGASDRIVDPVRIDGGQLTAFDHAAGSSRTFALHRITGAAPVD